MSHVSCQHFASKAFFSARGGHEELAGKSGITLDERDSKWLTIGDKNEGNLRD